MKQEFLLKAASFMIAKFEDDNRLSDIAISSGYTRSYSVDIKNIMIKYGVICESPENVEGKSKRYNLTDNGKLVQSNIRDIIKILNEVR